MGRKKILVLAMCTLVGINVGTLAKANEEIEKPGLHAIELEMENNTEGEKNAFITESGISSERNKAEILNTKANKISLGQKYYITSTSSNDQNIFYYDFTVPSDGVIELKIKNPGYNGVKSSWSAIMANRSNSEICFAESGNKQKQNDYSILKVGLKKGNYRLALKANFNIIGDLKIKTDFTVKHSANNKFESENNDTIERADYIALNTDYKGLGGDSDYFKIQTKRKGDINILLSHSSNHKFSSMGLYNASGELIDIISENSDMVNRGPYKQYTYKNAPLGTYYIRVYGYDAQSPYVLKVNQGDTNQNKFTDISGHYAEKDIVNFVNKGYTNGYKDATFRPEQSITRAEFIKFVNRTFGFTTEGTEKFIDVKDSDWFSNDIKIAVKAGYVSTKNSKFRPNAPITREEVAKIIADIKNNRDTNLDKLNRYKDKSQVSSWAKSSVEGVIEKGYMGKGSSYFRPKANITRAEAVVTLNRVK